MGGLFLIGIVGDIMVWEPLVDSYQQLEKKVAAQHMTLEWMEKAAQEIQQLRRSPHQPSPSSQSPLLILIDESLRHDTLQKATLEPQGEEEMIVSFETVSFTKMLQWLEKLYNQHQIKVKTLSIERQPEPDQVKIKIILGKF